MAEDDRTGADRPDEGVSAPDALAEAEDERVRAKAKMVTAEADKVKAETKKIKAEVARAKAEESRAKADLARIEAEKERASANREIAKNMNEQPAGGLGVRDFVKQSLLDIMAGVDDAAAVGRTRAFHDGLDGYLPAVTVIGAASAEGHAIDRVEFDLAVTATQAKGDETDEGVELRGDLKVGAFGVGSFHLGASGHIERVTSEASSLEQVNRLRFSVPIVYAVQDDSVDDE